MTVTTLPLPRFAPAVGEVMLATGGVVSVDGAAGCRVTRSVPDWAPMSARMFTVACWTSTEGAGPTPSWWLSSPQDQSMVPAENTSAPLAARYSVMFWVTTPGPTVAP